MMEMFEAMQRYSWMTEDQAECADFFAGVVGGYHHLSGEFKEFGSGLKISSYSDRWGTFDADLLTRLVIRAHDKMIRVQLMPSGPGRVSFSLFKRKVREGAMHHRHPTIEEAITKHRIKSQ